MGQRKNCAETQVGSELEIGKGKSLEAKSLKIKNDYFGANLIFCSETVCRSGFASGVFWGLSPLKRNGLWERVCEWCFWGTVPIKKGLEKNIFFLYNLYII
jgi:hypothetical protein